MRDELIISCSCSHIGHSVRFSNHEYGGDAFEAYIDVMMDYDCSFWQRLSNAWRYLAKSVCGFGIAAECIVRDDDLPRIQAWLDRAKGDAARRAPKGQI